MSPNELARELWSNWIQEHYTQDATLSELAAWFTSRPRSPRRLDAFLVPHRARRLAAVLRSIPRWEQNHCILGESGELVEIPRDAWLARAPEDRWSQQHHARPLAKLLEPGGFDSAERRSTFLDFTLFTLLGPGLRSWLSAVVGQPLDDKTTCEIVRYEEGDFISRHSDNHDPRILGINFYLGEHWSPECGGLLGYRNERGDELTLEPLFNSLSLIPIDPACCHWVTPWRDATSGRETFCMSVRPCPAGA